MFITDIVVQFIDVKSTVTKGQTLQHIQRIQSRWQELEDLTSQITIAGLPIIDLDAEDLVANKAVRSSSSVADLWNAKLDRILQRVNQGNFNEAWVLSGSLMRAIEGMSLRCVIN